MAGNLVVGTLRALLTADSAEFVKGVRKAEDSLSGFDKSLKGFGKSSQQIGQALLPMSAALAAVGGFAIKSAMDFQDSFAGIGKTVEGVVSPLGGLTEAGKALEAQMRQIATVIPVNVNDLNRLGEVAGAMGVPMEKVADFSKTMALLGVTTELSAETAATSIAQIQTVYKSAGVDTDRFANALVNLGNKGASSEDQILELTQRLAGTGQIIGLTQPQVMGFAAAMANVGINAEAGGTALSTVFSSLDKHVAAGGQKLEKFAAIAEMSATDFAAAFKTKPAEAINAFLVGLGKVEGKGINLNTALDSIGMSGIRVADTLKRLAGNTDQVTQALADGEEGWRTNNAMTNEADIRFKTVSNQLKLLWGQVREVGISLGTVLLPKISDAVAVFQTWIPTLTAGVKWFEALDPATKNWGVALAGLAIVLPPLLIALGSLALAVTAIGLPVLAAVAGFAAFTAAAGLIWVAVGEAEKNILAFVKSLYEGINHFLGGELTKIFERVGRGVDKVIGYFQGLYDAVIGHSSMVDTINGIDTQTQRLQAVLVAPVEKTTAAAAGAFEKMQQQTAESMERLAAQGRDWINTLGEMELATAKANLAFEQSGVRIAAVTTTAAINTAALREAMNATRDLSAAGELLSYDMNNVALAMDATAVAARVVNEEVSYTPGIFATLGAIAKSSFANLNTIFQAAFTGGGGILGAVQSFATQATASLLNMIPVVGPALSQFAGSIVAMFSKIGVAIKDLFGGPNAAEREGRSVAAQFREDLAGTLTEVQKLEVAAHVAAGRNRAWAESTIAIRDAYLAAGRSEQEALTMANRLWEAEKQGGAATKRVIDEIVAAMGGRLPDATRVAADAVADLAYDVQRVRDEISKPIIIPIAMAFQDVSTKGDEQRWAAQASDEQIRAAASDFASRNPGDAHRLGSALGLSLDQLRRAGVPGFAGGTPWLAPLDFGSGTLAMLHGQESIVPAGRERDFAAAHGDAAGVADLLRTEFAHMRQLLPTMVMTAVRDQLQLGARRA